MRKFSFYSACFASLFLMACTPNIISPIPTGYTYHGDLYKSPSGQQARQIGAHCGADAGQLVLEDMQSAAQDLVQKLDKKLSFASDEIYLNLPANTSFYTSFDHLLRAELTSAGYLISSTPEGGVTLDLVIRKTLPYCDKPHVDPNVDPSCLAQTMYVGLALDVGANKKPRDLIGSYYNIVLHDYVPTYTVDISDMEAPSVGLCE